MSVEPALARIAEAFGPSAPLEELAQDLADADARRRQRSPPHTPVDFAGPGVDPTLYLFEVYAWSLPWLEPDRLCRHVAAILRAGLAHERASPDGHVYRSIECIHYLLSPDNPASVRAHQRALWQPLTSCQRAAVAAYLVHTRGSLESAAAWGRAVEQEAADEDWRESVWPAPRPPGREQTLSLIHEAFPPKASEPWTALGPGELLQDYLPFAPRERLEALLPALAAFVLQEDQHEAAPAAKQQLCALLQPVDGPPGTPPLRARLKTLTPLQRRALWAVARRTLVGDDLHDLWTQAADLSGPDWMDHLRHPEWAPSTRRASFLESARAARATCEDATPDALERDHASVALQIEAAFDGVPPPGPGERTLFEAEHADSCFTHDVSRGRAPHRGRWQDLPLPELRDCGSALPHLGATGLRYYAPAIMIRFLHWREVWNEGDEAQRYLALFDSIGFMFSPSLRSFQLRGYLRRRLSPLTMEQRRAIHAFMVAIEEQPHAVAAWERVVAHDASGAPGPWFDALWPDRDRPDPADVIEEVCAAFDVPPTASSPAADVVPLSTVHPDQFAECLALEALFALTATEGPARTAAIDRLERALHPSWGSASDPKIRARLGRLTRSQRQAVSAVCDACIDTTSIRQMWRAAADHDGKDWFESLRAT